MKFGPTDESRETTAPLKGIFEHSPLFQQKLGIYHAV